jgi:hypothetical protein
MKPGALAKIGTGNKKRRWGSHAKLHGGEGSHPRLNLYAPIHAKLWYMEFKNTESVQLSPEKGYLIVK